MDKENKNVGIKGQVMSGLFWKFGERIIAQGVSFVVTMLLARLLLPEEYGIVALVMVFINLANVFVTTGLGDALVQRAQATRKDFSTIFYCGVGVSAVLYIIIFFSAPWIADFYDNQQLILVLRVLSIQIPLSSVKTVQHAYVQRHMIFRKFFWSTLGGTLISGVVGIAMAYAGYGVWALVAQYLVNSVIDMLILFITVNWKPHLEFDRKSAREMLNFSWSLVLSSFINEFYLELKSLLIGKYYREADLASYNKGNQFPALLINNINASISSVLFPAMAKCGDDPVALKNITRKSIRLSTYILLPMLAGLMAVAKPLVQLLLTDNWLPCVPFLQISCIFWMFQPSQTANVQAIKAAGRSDICLKLELVKKVIGVLLILVTIRINVYAVVIANAAFAGISACINIIPNKKLIHYGTWEQLRDVLPSIFLSLLVFFSAGVCLRLPLGSFAMLVVQICVGAAVYIAGSFILKVDSFYYLLNHLKAYFCKNGREQ